MRCSHCTALLPRGQSGAFYELRGGTSLDGYHAAGKPRACSLRCAEAYDAARPVRDPRDAGGHDLVGGPWRWQLVQGTPLPPARGLQLAGKR